MPKRHLAPEARRPLDRLHQVPGRPHPSHPAGASKALHKIDASHRIEAFAPGSYIVVIKPSYVSITAYPPFYSGHHLSLAKGLFRYSVGFGSALNYEYGHCVDSWCSNQMARMKGFSPLVKLVAMQLCS